ncbi:hypothetical protein VPMS16_1015 [Vibrio sp. 16]|nr:hypothetical protein VPMS16_1015 [Vibrio sp. 16]
MNEKLININVIQVKQKQKFATNHHHPKKLQKLKTPTEKPKP